MKSHLWTEWLNVPSSRYHAVMQLGFKCFQYIGLN